MTRMKKRMALFFFIAAIALLIAQNAFAQAPWTKIPVPQLPAFHPQEPKRIELPNGMVIFLQEDHELPTIDGIARIRGGSRLEPGAKVGLVSLYGEVWRTGGTKNQTGDQLDDYLEIRAAKVETDGNADSTTIALSCLKEDFSGAFKAFTDLLREPEFRDWRYCGPRIREARVWRAEPLCPRAGICNHRRRHAPGPSGLAPHLRSSQQHHSWICRRLRFGAVGSHAAQRVQ